MTYGAFAYAQSQLVMTLMTDPKRFAKDYPEFQTDSLLKLAHVEEGDLWVLAVRNNAIESLRSFLGRCGFLRSDLAQKYAGGAWRICEDGRSGERLQISMGHRLSHVRMGS